MRKGVVLVVVLGVMIVISALAFVAVYLMTQESRIAEHKIRRMRGYFAAQAGVVDALERLRTGNSPGGTECTTFPPTVGDSKCEYDLAQQVNNLDVTVIIHKAKSGYTPCDSDAADILSDFCVSAEVDY